MIVTGRCDVRRRSTPVNVSRNGRDGPAAVEFLGRDDDDRCSDEGYYRRYIRDLPDATNCCVVDRARSPKLGTVAVELTDVRRIREDLDTCQRPTLRDR